MAAAGGAGELKGFFSETEGRTGLIRTALREERGEPGQSCAVRERGAPVPKRGPGFRQEHRGWRVRAEGRCLQVRTVSPDFFRFLSEGGPNRWGWDGVLGADVKETAKVSLGKVGTHAARINSAIWRQRAGSS